MNEHIQTNVFAISDNFSEEYDYIFPVSKNCFLDAYLRYRELYSDATPFGAMHNFEGHSQNEEKYYNQYKLISGIYGFKGKIELLISNFYKYFEFDDLEIIVENDCYPIEEKGRMIVGNRKTGLSFYHTFPANITLEKYYPTAKETFDKRIERLRLYLAKSQKILIVFSDCNWYNALPGYKDSYDNNEYIQDDIILSCYKQLKKIYPEKHIDMIFIEHDKTKQNRKKYLNANILRLRTNFLFFNRNVVFQYQYLTKQPRDYEIISMANIFSHFRLRSNE